MQFVGLANATYFPFGDRKAVVTGSDIGMPIKRGPRAPRVYRLVSVILATKYKSLPPAMPSRATFSASTRVLVVVLPVGDARTMLHRAPGVPPMDVSRRKKTCCESLVQTGRPRAYASGKTDLESLAACSKRSPACVGSPPDTANAADQA